MTWRQYQEEAAEFFRALGLEAQTDVKVEGVRTRHDVDVLVKSHHVGFDVTWIVECKQWNTRISKVHVLALRTIVSETGADKGILLSEKGFQSGAIEAAKLTNVDVTSLHEAEIKSEHDINAMRLQDLFDRTEECKTRYWDIPKEIRIERGLRPDVGNVDYSGIIVISAGEELLRKDLRGMYPFTADILECFTLSEIPETITSPRHLIEILEPMISDLETRLDSATQP